MTTQALHRPLHDDDLHAWALDQAARLRDLARRRLNEPVDWELLADEVEDMARSEQRAAEAFLKLVILHLLELDDARDPEPREHGRKEIGAFRRTFWRRTTPSITARLRGELDAIHDLARAKTLAALWQDPDLEGRLPRTCPYDWDQVTGEWLP